MTDKEQMELDHLQAQCAKLRAETRHIEASIEGAKKGSGFWTVEIIKVGGALIAVILGGIGAVSGLQLAQAQKVASQNEAWEYQQKAEAAKKNMDSANASLAAVVQQREALEKQIASGQNQVAELEAKATELQKKIDTLPDSQKAALADAAKAVATGISTARDTLQSGSLGGMHLYVFYSSPVSQARAQELWERCKALGVRSVHVMDVAKTGGGKAPEQNEVRYHYTPDRPLAEQFTRLVEQAGLAPVKTEQVAKRYQNGEPGRVELWLKQQ